MMSFWKSWFEKKTSDASERTAALFRPQAFDETSDVFLLDNALGCAFDCTPLNGTSDSLQERVKGLMQIAYPANAIVQFCLFRSPDIAAWLNRFDRLRFNTTEDLQLLDSVKAREAFLKKYSRQPLITHLPNGASYKNGFVFDMKLLVAVIVPTAGEMPTQDEFGAFKQLQSSVKSALTTLELLPQVVTADTYLRFMQSLVNWNSKAGWTADTSRLWEPEKTLAEQIFDADTELTVTESRLKLGDYAYLKVLSAKHLPELYYFGSALQYAGTLDGSDGDQQYPYAVCCNCYFPDKESLKSEITRKRQFTVNQAYGPIAKFSPELLDKKASFDILDKSLREGNKPMLMTYSVLVWGKTEKEAEANAQNMADTWRERGFTLLADKFVQLPVFMECLPLNADKAAVKGLWRYKTLTTEQAGVLVPIFGEWKGTGTPHMLLMSRNGQLMTFSLHDTGSNKNCVIAAQSGSGKSFLINALILAYLSVGAQIWVIDAGKSYKKLCEDFQGDFLQFDDASDIRMNPFELINNYEEEEDTLVSLLLNMASQKGALEDIQITGLKRVLNALWKERRTEMTVDDVAAALLKNEDQRLRDIGSQLYPFTKNAAYGRYFAKGNNVSFKNRFTVLELDELQGRKHLRQVVLLQLIMQIQHEVYLGDRNRIKIVIVDEAWDLLKEGEVAHFMEGAYRKFRKYNGSVVIATQSVNDLYNNPAGRAIAENSATMCLLGQKAESVESVRKSGYLELNEGLFQQLKSVHTIAGVYSEIFIRSEHGCGVTRLFVDDYSKLQFSTAPQDLNAIKYWTDRGLSNSEAIKRVLADRENAVGV